MATAAKTPITTSSDVSRETQAVCGREHDSGETCTNPLDTTGSPPWCRECRAKYQRQYRSIQKQMSEGRGFCAGVVAAKHLLASEFERNIRGAMISGHEAARLVRACKGPALPTT